MRGGRRSEWKEGLRESLPDLSPVSRETRKRRKWAKVLPKYYHELGRGKVAGVQDAAAEEEAELAAEEGEHRPDRHAQLLLTVQRDRQFGMGWHGRWRAGLDVGVFAVLEGELHGARVEDAESVQVIRGHEVPQVPAALSPTASASPKRTRPVAVVGELRGHVDLGGVDGAVVHDLGAGVGAPGPVRPAPERKKAGKKAGRADFSLQVFIRNFPSPLLGRLDTLVLAAATISMHSLRGSGGFEEGRREGKGGGDAEAPGVAEGLVVGLCDVAGLDGGGLVTGAVLVRQDVVARVEGVLAVLPVHLLHLLHLQVPGLVPTSRQRSES